MRRAHVSGFFASWIRYRIAYLFAPSSVAKTSLAVSFSSNSRCRSSGTVAVFCDSVSPFDDRRHETPRFYRAPRSLPSSNGASITLDNPFITTVRTDCTPQVRFSTTVGEEPEVETPSGYSLMPCSRGCVQVDEFLEVHLMRTGAWTVAPLTTHTE